MMEASTAVLLMALYDVLGQQCIRGAFPYAMTFSTTEMFSKTSTAQTREKEREETMCENITFPHEPESLCNFSCQIRIQILPKDTFCFIQTSGQQTDGQHKAVLSCIHPSSGVLSLDMFGKQINQCQLELHSKPATSW
ncbi:Hypothetical predicted protein [Xyrichtys novacula]|uniref:Uncharacterized protein n=1 Tax=Xyrichtys novacula TaxID=13765 RepID=A0AAV1H0W2_XYRNO|nr:Hypothetical predicted protein [Xyrichtys novacula]